MVKKYSIDKNELDNLLHAMKQVCSSGPSTQDVAIKALRKMGKEFENKISDFNEKEEEKDVFVPTHINVVDGSKIQVLDTTLDASIHFPSSIRYVTWRKSLHEQKYTLQDIIYDDEIPKKTTKTTRLKLPRFTESQGVYRGLKVIDGGKPANTN